MQRRMHWSAVAGIIQNGIPQGCRPRYDSAHHAWEWDISAGCLRPLLVELTGVTMHQPEWIKSGFVSNHLAAGAKFAKRLAWGVLREQKRLFLDLHVKCRRCDVCRRKNSQRYAAKARAEIAEAQRTWMVSLTLTPEQHYRVQCEAGSEDIIERHKVISKEITKAIKRLRKNTGAKLRYISVCEAHKSGLPHYHMLIHEIEGSVKYRDLVQMWRWGFVHAKLVPEADAGKASWYVCKYVAKDARARVRSSIMYGRNPCAPLLLLKKLMGHQQHSELHSENTISDHSGPSGARGNNDDLPTMTPKHCGPGP